jgi:hypothetical protein
MRIFENDSRKMRLSQLARRAFGHRRPLHRIGAPTRASAAEDASRARKFVERSNCRWAPRRTLIALRFAGSANRRPLGAMSNGSAWACLRIYGRMWSRQSLSPNPRVLPRHERTPESVSANQRTGTCPCRAMGMAPDAFLITCSAARFADGLRLIAIVVPSRHAAIRCVTRQTAP